MLRRWLWLAAVCSMTGSAFAEDTVEQLARRADEKYGKLSDLSTTGPVQNLQHWAIRREEIGKTLLDYLGQFPKERVELKPRILREEQLVGFRRLKVRYLTQPGEDVTAFLLVPDDITSAAPGAAILACHQTHEAAKEEVCGLAGKESMHYGLDLVRRGYVVLAPDSITAGERIYDGYEPFETAAFDKANPEWSAIGKMAWDHMRGIDYLETLDFVDKQRIGVIGHSLGAYNALFLAAFDDRAKVVVESCGYCAIASDAGRERWARTSWFVHIPRLRSFVEPGSNQPAPFDFHHIISRIAPRPVFQSVGLRDKIFPTADSAAQVHEKVAEIYGIWKKSANLQSFFFDGEHDFPPDAKRLAYEFLDRHLKK